MQVSIIWIEGWGNSQWKRRCASFRLKNWLRQRKRQFAQWLLGTPALIALTTSLRLSKEGVACISLPRGIYTCGVSPAKRLSFALKRFLTRTPSSQSSYKIISIMLIMNFIRPTSISISKYIINTGWGWQKGSLWVVDKIKKMTDIWYMVWTFSMTCTQVYYLICTPQSKILSSISSHLVKYIAFDSVYTFLLFSLFVYFFVYLLSIILSSL